MCRTPKQPPHHDYEKMMKVCYFNENEALKADPLECNGIKAFRVICNFVQINRVVHEIVGDADRSGA